MRDSLYFRYGGPSPWRADAAFAAHAVTTAIRRRSRSVDRERERDIGADGAGAGPLTAISIYLRTDCRAAGGSSLFPTRVSFPHKRHPLIAVATRVGSALRATSKFHQAGPTRLRRRPGSALRQVRGLCVWSGRICVLLVEFGAGPTTLCRWSGPTVSFPNSTTWTDPTRPDQTRRQSPYMSRLSGKVYDRTESAEAVRGSGLVGSVQWNLKTIRPASTSDKVWPGPSV